METLLLSALGLSIVFAILAVVMTSDEGPNGFGNVTKLETKGTGKAA